MPINKDIQAYNSEQPDTETCEALAAAIGRGLSKAVRGMYAVAVLERAVI